MAIDKSKPAGGVLNYSIFLIRNGGDISKKSSVVIFRTFWRNIDNTSRA